MPALTRTPRSGASNLTGSFSTCADRALGRWAGFSIGWLYAWFWIIVLGIEATAGAPIVHRWIPGVDQWVWALVLRVLRTVTNVVSVKSFGEFERWFASIKVAAMPGVDARVHLTGHGGFFPNESAAVLGGVLVVVFSFFGAAPPWPRARTSP